MTAAAGSPTTGSASTPSSSTPTPPSPRLATRHPRHPRLPISSSRRPTPPPYVVNAINPKFVLHGWIHDHRVGRVGAFRGLGGAIRASAPRRAPRALRDARVHPLRLVSVALDPQHRGSRVRGRGLVTRAYRHRRGHGRGRASSSDHAWFGAATLALGAYQPSTRTCARRTRRRRNSRGANPRRDDGGNGSIGSAASRRCSRVWVP